MNSKKEIIKRLVELKPYLSEEYAVKQIGIFGSYLNNTFTDASDIDLLVDFEKPIGWKFLTLEIYLEKIFNKKIDLVTRNALKEQIKDSILKQVEFIY
jgi:predicted nucleotidyltransferase